MLRSEAAEPACSRLFGSRELLMAFGYEYLMVHLPEVCPSSFLLFVHNPAGATKLRDYSSGKERQLSTTISTAEVLSQTKAGRTRFHYEPHRTNDTGVAHWSQVTQQLNRTVVIWRW